MKAFFSVMGLNYKPNKLEGNDGSDKAYYNHSAPTVTQPTQSDSEILL